MITDNYCKTDSLCEPAGALQQIDDPTNEDLVERFQQGDATVFQQIVDRNRGLIYNQFFRNWHNRRANRDDCESEILWRVWKAVKGFDHSLGYKFTTYLGSTLCRSFRRESRRNSRLNLRFASDMLEDFRLEDFPAREQCNQVDSLQERFTRLSRRVLSDKERFLLIGRMNGLTVRELAWAYGVSQQCISAIVNQAISRLRDSARREDESLGVESFS